MSSNINNQGQQQVSMKFVTLVSMVAALGGLLFGFDTAVVSGAIGFMKERFTLNEVEVGWAVSSLIIGCIVGAAGSGVLGDRFGRKKVLIMAALLFIIGSIGSAIPDTFTGYIIARIIGGLGIGITSTLCPLYNAEIAPAQYRGRLVALNQFATVTGIFLVYFINLGIAGYGDDAWDISTAWRWMFGFGALPGLLFLVLLFFVPESPRWLIKQGRAVEALPILLKIHGEDLAKKEVLDIKASFKQESGSIRQLFSPALRLALIVGVGLAVLQQVTGINAIMYYAPEIFKETGSGTNASLMQTILVGLINFLFTILAVWLIDKVGRKALLLVGSASMTVCLVVIGAAFQTGHTSGPLVLIFILLYVAAFAVSLGPVVWVVMSEIFPNRIRGKATAIASMALWAADYIVSQTFPPMLSSAGPAITFWLFGFMSLFTFFFTWRVVPETKGKSLEEIESLWSRN
ncbi:arabinose-proton symporter [Paenibacillus baekrokdamisoli]|uniref:Arabinose-proton symporter n=1 Tax=Paenibacillus baekrokdamisoli TaxID=1712516 RepID=A0A3G9JLH4_9BACL|nr:sugar porter family MFS transporter [Paenibacillus baekrokdamisoli]MBB3069397.1 SP family arabinose:H+ symporter-like MFS transporter [Paenibacillus baekrokdamisoli]BBH25028.1 arabinose-proton symporter [Paenibacillus baekrokdamisoli]BBH25046.1 arabinose-proton symporter [Paenibacillus baekrokdamisoli]